MEHTGQTDGLFPVRRLCAMGARWVSVGMFGRAGQASRSKFRGRSQRGQTSRRKLIEHHAQERPRLPFSVDQSDGDMTKSRVERGAHKHRWLDTGSGPQREHFEARRSDVRPSGADFTVLGVKVCVPSISALVDVGTSSAVFAFAWIAITSEKAMTRTRLGSRDHPTTAPRARSAAQLSSSSWSKSVEVMETVSR